MTFCGQCGLQLSPGMTRCPRCGTLVEEPGMANGELHTDDPTMASHSILSQYQQANQANQFNQTRQSSPLPNPNTPRPPLILRSSNPNEYDNSSATSQTRSVNQPVPSSPSSYPPNNFAPGAPGTRDLGMQDMRTGYQGYPPSNGNYAPSSPYPPNSAPGNYPTYSSQGNFSHPSMPTASTGYPGSGPAQSMGYAQTPGPYQSSSTARNAQGKKIAMALIIVGLALILCAIVLFALGQSLL
jgi:hypothetical protein